MKKETESYTSEPTAESLAITFETTDSARLDAGGTAETEVSAVASQDLLGRILSIAQRHRKEGNIQQAKELFWTLAEEHSETPQADAARAELLALAEGYASAVASQTLLERLLFMAQQYRKEGNFRQAIELLWTLVEGHLKTPQGAAAKAELLSLADEYESNDDRHMARSIYERLMALED
jgi:tetratricopeptide (TPR) repeat protein